MIHRTRLKQLPKTSGRMPAKDITLYGRRWVRHVTRLDTVYHHFSYLLDKYARVVVCVLVCGCISLIEPKLSTKSHFSIIFFFAAHGRHNTTPIPVAKNSQVLRWYIPNVGLSRAMGVSKRSVFSLVRYNLTLLLLPYFKCFNLFKSSLTDFSAKEVQVQ